MTENKGKGKGSVNAGKTACPQGHPYHGDNLRIVDSGWGIARACKTCRREACLRYREKKRQQKQQQK